MGPRRPSARWVAVGVGVAALVVALATVGALSLQSTGAGAAGVRGEIEARANAPPTVGPTDASVAPASTNCTANLTGSLGSGSPDALASPPATPRPAFNAEFYFSEVGLAYATSWTVVVVGVSADAQQQCQSSTSNLIQVIVPGGTYVYAVEPVPGYLEAYVGNVTVEAAIQIVVQFHVYPSWAPPIVLTGIALWGIFVLAVSIAFVRR